MALAIEKLFFNVSKKLIHFITEPIPLYHYETVLFNKCCYCPFYKKMQDKNIHNYCSNYCNNKYKKVIKKYKIYNNINIDKTHIQFSLTQIKQMLIYYYYANSKGFVSLISKKRIAKMIGCCEKTVDINNKLFSDLGLILISGTINNKFSLIIKDYSEHYNKNNTGYLNLATNVFKDLLHINNVNALRIALQGILKHDINTLLDRETYFSINSMKTFLPNYINCKSAIEKIINKLNNNTITMLFNSSEKLIFVISKNLHGKLLKKEMYYKYKNNFLNYITENNIKLNNLSNSINNIVKLAFEYGYDIVQLMLGEIKDIAPTIFNVGGYIRDKIKRYIYMNEPFFAV
ncbi:MULTISPECIES: hypothetical protein [Clostridium]|uniref:Uncharacterized protein n=1 Tax=Clostridium sporogenes TaxID=1509 RepID=A0A1J1CRH1_CLOSG|nr:MULTISPECIES: hypothetical protein [Clostridium]APF25253.1 hypothetical protein NPD7_3964 [Clostridium sporogenes]APH15082.1 hypothetical protein NPD5_4059 [Clostridium sporogenes]MBD5640636.1 hypothetical protein [Clostridium botulinum]MDI6919122.1 hypothetical protein [Clostridium botulinum]WMU99661.1 hypothetical protein QA656_18680 [Clostridium botulinum]